MPNVGALVWDQIGEKLYEAGVDHGVVYPVNTTNNTYDAGYAWNGLISVTESPSGAEPTDLYADNIKYVSMRSAENFGGTIEAYTYPPEFANLDGTAEVATGVRIGQQKRGMFGLSYRSLVGNDTDSNDHGYKLHLVYGATCSPSEKGYETVNDSPDAITFSWEFTTTPVSVTGYKPTAILTIDSTKADATKLANLEKILYGFDGTATYTEFSGSTFVAGTDYYTRTGTEGAYVYTKTTDATPQSGVTYYTKSVSGATSPRLPLPNEVMSLMAAG